MQAIGCSMKKLGAKIGCKKIAEIGCTFGNWVQPEIGCIEKLGATTNWVQRKRGCNEIGGNEIGCNELGCNKFQSVTFELGAVQHDCICICVDVNICESVEIL